MSLSGSDKIEMSVVIAVHNDREGLASTLSALAAQDLDPARFEVVIVDDGSTDGTPVVSGEHSNVSVIARATSGGSYVARNEGLRAAQGEFIAITDADCRPEAAWLSRGLAYLKRDPSRVYAGHIRMPLGTKPTVAAMVDVMLHLDQEKYARENGSAATANLMASAATFREVGGFDERLRSSGDAEWTRRAGKRGHPVVYAGDAVVVHDPRESAQALLRKSRRVGEGARAAARAGLTSGKAVYLTKWCVVPYGRERGRERLRENGYEPSRCVWWYLAFAQVALVQLPQAYYGLRWDLRTWWSARRAGAASGGDVS
jgi:glycosyltransferase involved in cell wall biosynthesis